VFTLDEEVADWCEQPIDFGRGRGFLFPVVVRPRTIPVILDPARAMAAPELAVLSVLAHGREPGAEFIAQAALAACERLDTQAGIHYADFVEAFLGDFARVALRQIMQTELKNPYFSDKFRKSFADGVAEGEAKGAARGKAQSLLKMLRLRGWTASAELEARVLACRDEAQVDQWIDRVLSVPTLDDVFDRP